MYYHKTPKKKLQVRQSGNAVLSINHEKKSICIPYQVLTSKKDEKKDKEIMTEQL